MKGYSWPKHIHRLSLSRDPFHLKYFGEYWVSFTGSWWRSAHAPGPYPLTFWCRVESVLSRLRSECHWILRHSLKTGVGHRHP